MILIYSLYQCAKLGDFYISPNNEREVILLEFKKTALDIFYLIFIVMITISRFSFSGWMSELMWFLTFLLISYSKKEER